MAEKKIQGVTYRCTNLPADLGLRYLLRLTKVLGPAAPLLEAIIGPQEQRRDVLAAGAIRQFIADMSQAEVYDLIIDLVQECRADGEPCVIGVKPQDVNELLQVFTFAVTTNFADFFGAAGPGGVFTRRMLATVLIAEADAFVALWKDLSASPWRVSPQGSAIVPALRRSGARSYLRRAG